MHAPLLTAFLCLSVPAGVAMVLAPGEQGPDQEPSLLYELQIGDETFELSAGEATKIEIGDEEHTVTLTPSAYRQFDAEGITFEYPAEMTFAYESYFSGHHEWSFDTVDVGVLIQVSGLDQGELFTDFLQSLSETFEEMGATVDSSDCSIEFDGETVAGTRLLANLESIGEIDHEIYPLGSTGVILFQDSRDTDGVATPSFIEIRDQIASSLAFYE